jgi:hypothetical protein
MTFTHPLAWGLLLLAVPIILFFFLKIRFRREAVATTIFWQQVFEERRTRTLRRQFRHFLSLILALLFLALLTVAALDPVVQTPEDHRYVVIIDNSASMNALLAEGEKTRLDVAKRHAADRLSKTAASQQAAILTASVNPKIVSGFTDHTSALRRKLAEIPATDFPADVPAAILLAEKLIAKNPYSSIYVYTGTALPENATLAPNIHVVHVGQPIDNLAITRFQPRRLPNQLRDYEILVEMVNFGAKTVETNLEIDRDGELVDVIPLSLEPNQTLTKIVRNASAKGGLFRATLTSTDLFPADNTAVAFLSEQFVQRVLLYGTENFFLWNVLQVQPQTEVSVIETLPDSIPPDSVLVLHQTIPKTLPPGNILVIDPQNDTDLFRVEQRLERPIAATVDPKNALVRFIQPGLICTGAKTLIPQQNNFKVMVETADAFPLYLQFVSEEQRVLVLSADLNSGDFSLRTAFPILISRALAYFRGSDALLKAYSTAESVTLAVPTEKTQVLLRSPSGKESLFPCQHGEVSLGKLGELGVWTIFEWESQRPLTQIACNLFSTTESDLRSAAETPVRSAGWGFWFARPIWHYFALSALLLTVAEWFLYQRRWIE